MTYYSDNYLDLVKNNIVKFFNNDKLNPLKCNSDGLMCDPVILYIISMIILMIFIFISRKTNNSKFSTLMYIFINMFIAIGCALLLINLCIYKKPTLYSYVIIMLSVTVTYIINTLF